MQGTRQIDYMTLKHQRLYTEILVVVKHYRTIIKNELYENI